MAEYKLVIVGTGGVGKSALAIKYVQNHFIADYEPTIEDSYVINSIIEGRRCVLDILDTSGQEEYSALRDHYWSSGEGFICVFSINDYNSFEQLDEYITKLSQVKAQDDTPMVLVGNKNDLEKLRVVDNALARDYARRKCIPYIETSAKTGQNVKEVFATIVNEIERYKTLQKETPPKDHIRPKCCQIL